MPLDYSRIHDANKQGQVRERCGGGGGGERNLDRVRELLVTEPHKKRCVFPSGLCTSPKSKVSLFSAWVNEKVWELVTYCTGVLLDWVYILN